MAVPRRVNKKQNLIEVPTLITEEGLIDTKYFNVVGLKEELPTGKSSFLVGGSEFLKPKTIGWFMAAVELHLMFLYQMITVCQSSLNP